MEATGGSRDIGVVFRERREVENPVLVVLVEFRHGNWTNHSSFNDLLQCSVKNQKYSQTF
jgi:hypothetical protein